MTALRAETLPPRDQSIALTMAGETLICDRAGVLYLPAFDTMIVSDLHLEKGSASARRRQFIPPYDTAETLRRLALLVAHYNPGRIVSLGDSFHDGWGAERLCTGDRSHLTSLMEQRDWIWVAGNHDPDAPANLPGVTAHEVAIGNLLLRHEPSLDAAEGEIAGHLHPGARIVRRGRSVRRACFATDGVRMIMPAFGAYTGCLNILDTAYQGLFAAQSLKALMLGKDRIYPITRRHLCRG